MKRQPHNLKGVSVIELLVVMAVISVAFAALSGASLYALRIAEVSKATIQAQALAKEAMDALVQYRNTVPWNADDPANQYDGLGMASVETAYHLATSTESAPRWMLLAGEEAVERFTRSIVLSAVSRDLDSNITETGGTADAYTRRVRVTVSWDFKGNTKRVELTSYLTNWR
ncbi:MAG: type II secretion system protein [bacterium]|nr:type II secretion system protein [bacterium]MDZ4296642.1 type II secretion system protein [Patescibacteria group bacterium]